MSKKENKYTFIPDEYKVEYETYLRKEEAREIREKADQRFEKRKESLKRMSESLEEQSNNDSENKRSKFLESIEKCDIDYEEIYKNMDKTQKDIEIKKVYNAIIIYCNEKNINLNNGLKITKQGNKIMLKYTNEKGEIMNEEFSMEDFYKEEQK